MEESFGEAASHPRLERPEELAEAGAALAARHSPGEVAREAVAQARRLLRADAAVLYADLGEGARLLAGVGLTGEGAPPLLPDMDRAGADAVYALGLRQGFQHTLASAREHRPTPATLLAVFARGDPHWDETSGRLLDALDNLTATALAGAWARALRGEADP
ncbi:MAG: hypothetical protein ACUVX9_15225 [Anaerolineae bacterium]